ncbi:hypothetical protein BJ138DRAFT_1020415, partial [Hygrophoropsis aurantiaca]
STHNSRIERSWVETGVRFVHPWRAFFFRLERLHQLDRSNHHHLWLLHQLFLSEISDDCKIFCEEWNAHPISGEGHDQSPNDMRFMGQLEHGIYMEDELHIHPDIIQHYYGSSAQGEHPTPPPVESTDEEEWEDVEMTTEAATGYADLPSLIADDQAPQFLHDGVSVPKHASPFPESELEDAFWLALREVQELDYIPAGYGMIEEEWDGEGYPEIEVIRSGRRGRKEMTIALPDCTWRPRAVRWCQALEVLTYTLGAINESTM